MIDRELRNFRVLRRILMRFMRNIHKIWYMIEIIVPKLILIGQLRHKIKKNRKLILKIVKLKKVLLVNKLNIFCKEIKISLLV